VDGFADEDEATGVHVGAGVHVGVGFPLGVGVGSESSKAWLKLMFLAAGAPKLPVL
jgi:hypothetical protein